MALEYENIQTPNGQPMGLWRYCPDEASPAVDVSAHFHLMTEVMWFRRAQGVVEVGGERWRVKPGTLLFVPPLLTHSLVVEAGAGDFYLLQFESKYYEEIDLPLQLQPVHQAMVLHLDEEDAARVNPLFEWAHKVSDENLGLRDSLLRTLLVYVHGLKGSRGSEGEPSDPLERKLIPRLLPLLHHLEREQCLSMTLDQAASFCGLSRYYFSRMFKQAFAQTFKEYLLRLRIASAASLLRGSELTIAQIAYRCEFTDSAYFCAKFRKSMGISPRKFRLEQQKLA